MKNKKYPKWICCFCGNKYGKIVNNHWPTFHHGKCGWCGQKSAVTEPRDFGYPEFKQKKKNK